MAINQNHLFDELNGVKCAIVEKNATPERVAFLEPLLTFNHFTVVVVPSPPPKAAPAAAPPRPVAPPPPPASAIAPPATAPTAATDDPASAPPPAAAQPSAAAPPSPAPATSPSATPQAAPPQPTPAPAPPATFTIGVTDVTFNPTNAIFGRLLRTPDGHVVTLAYWQQKEKISNDEIPYFGT